MRQDFIDDTDLTVRQDLGAAKTATDIEASDAAALKPHSADKLEASLKVGIMDVQPCAEKDLSHECKTSVEQLDVDSDGAMLVEGESLQPNHIEDLENLKSRLTDCETKLEEFMRMHPNAPSDSLVEALLRIIQKIFNKNIPIEDRNTQTRFDTIKIAAEKCNEELFMPAIKEWREWECKAKPLFEKAVQNLRKLGVPIGGKEFHQSVVLPSLAEIGCKYAVLDGAFGLEISSEDKTDGLILTLKGKPDVQQGAKLHIFKIELDDCWEKKSRKKYVDNGYAEEFDVQILNLYRKFLDEYASRWVVAIKPDPATMWKRISFEDISENKFWKADTASKSCEAPSGYHVIAASQKGRSHWHQGSARDDDFGLKYDAGKGWNLLVVADGAGSKRYSRKGSKVVCEYLEEKLLDMITSEMEEHFHQYVMKQDEGTKQQAKLDLYKLFIRSSNNDLGAIAAAKKELVAVAQNENCSPVDFSTTLLCTIAKKFEEGWFFGSFMVGDGAMALYNSNEGVLLLGDPDEGEYSGQTRFITTESVWKDAQGLMDRITVESKPDFTALFLMTDGVSDPKFETEVQQKNKSKWAELYKEISSEVLNGNSQGDRDKILIKYLDFYTPGHHDDRTLAMLYKESQKDE